MKRWLCVSLFLGKSSAWWPITCSISSQGNETSLVKGTHGQQCPHSLQLVLLSKDGPWHRAQCGYANTKCHFYVYPSQHSGSRFQSACVTQLFLAADRQRRPIHPTLTLWDTTGFFKRLSSVWSSSANCDFRRKTNLTTVSTTWMFMYVFG